MRLSGKMSEPKWRAFEKLVHEIQTELAPRAEVILDNYILGVDSEALRQIDVTIRERIAGRDVLTILECKDHKVPIDLEVMEAFVGKVRDVRANRAVMVAASGFTSAATNAAKKNGIGTHRVVDVGNELWGRPVALPALLCRTYPKSFALRYSNFAGQLPPVFASARDLVDVPVLDSEGRPVGTIRALLREKCLAPDFGSTPGTHTDILLGHGLVIPHDGIDYRVDLYAEITVVVEYYFGPWPVERMRGFEDTQAGSITTSEFGVADLIPLNIETGITPGWSRVESPAQLAVRPVITLHYSDVCDDDDSNSSQMSNYRVGSRESQLERSPTASPDMMDRECDRNSER